MASTKITTGLAGLTVNPAAHRSLGILYGKILRTLQKMPSTAVYRRNTETIINERAKVLGKTADIEKIEDQICCGQVEELIVQAENELLLARKMLTWKPWEPLIKEAPETQWTWPPAKPACS